MAHSFKKTIRTRYIFHKVADQIYSGVKSMDGFSLTTKLSAQPRHLFYLRLKNR